MATLDETPEPDSLDALGDLFNFGGFTEEEVPKPNVTGRWFVSLVNPGSTLLKLPGLTLKPEVRMVSYLYRVADSGIGVTWAVPESLSGMAQLERALSQSGDRTQPPKPKGALADFMEAIEGDRTPASFVVASILRRELQEFGALGTFCNWTHHRLIETLPTQVSWQWRTQIPRDLSAKVRVLPEGQAAVEFFTCRIVPPVAIFRHLDQYPKEKYDGSSLDQVVAIAKR